MLMQQGPSGVLNPLPGASAGGPAADAAAEENDNSPLRVSRAQSSSTDPGEEEPWSLKREVSLLLHFSMLAASTIGPGTVVTCSKSGADFGLKLVWALVLASFVAYVLQEGSARLAIVSGFNLGQAMRAHLGPSSPSPSSSSSSSSSPNSNPSNSSSGGGNGGIGRRRKRGDDNAVPMLCGLVAVGVLVGNCAYECNNFVGATAALYALEAPSTVAARVLLTLLTAVLTLATLFCGDVDLVSRVLGTVVIFMVFLFLASVVSIGIEGPALGRGLVPNFPPDGGSVTALSMVSTTAIPFNCFLASSAAEGFELNEMKRGIAFSTAVAGILSFFIVVTGTGVKKDSGDDDEFTITDLTDTLKREEGSTASYGFGAGLYAAAYSSAISVALGAALTCQSLLGRQPKEFPNGQQTSGGGGGGGGGGIGSAQQPPKQLGNSSGGVGGSGSGSSGGAGGGSNHMAEASIENGSSSSGKMGRVSGTSMEGEDDVVEGGNDDDDDDDDSLHWEEKGLFFRGIIALLVFISFVVGASGADTIEVIVTAQVVNGFLLPVVALCLLVCLNDESLMRARPTTARDNACLLFAVFATIFLACETLIGSFVGDGGGDQADGDIFVASLITAVVLMVPVCWYVRKLVKAREGSVTYSSGLNVSPNSPGAQDRRRSTSSDGGGGGGGSGFARGSMESSDLVGRSSKNSSDLRDTTTVVSGGV